MSQHRLLYLALDDGMSEQVNERSCKSPCRNSLLPPLSGPPTPLLESALPLHALRPQTSLCLQAPLSSNVLVSLRLQELIAWASSVGGP